MIRNIILCLFLLGLTQTTFSQITFQPKWEKGDKKVVTRTTVEQEYLGQTLTETETTYMTSTLEVKEVTKTQYKLEIKWEDFDLGGMGDMYKSLGKERPIIDEMLFKVVVNRKDYSTKVTNWKEAQKLLFDNIDQMLNDMVASLMDENAQNLKEDEIRPIFETMFDPIKDLMKTEEAVNEVFLSEYDFLFVPFGKELSKEKAFIINNTQKNPMAPNMTMTMEESHKILQYSRDKKNCTIRTDVSMDMEEYKQALKIMIGEMMTNSMKEARKHMKDEDEDMSDEAIAKLVDEKVSEFDDMDLEQTSYQLTSFNVKTGWADKMEGHSIITFADKTNPDRKKITKINILVK